LLISHSSRLFFQQCHRKYYWTAVEGLEPSVTPEPFARGRLGHRLVDEWVKDKSKADLLVQDPELAQHPLLTNALTEYFIKNAEEPLKYIMTGTPVKVDMGVVVSTSGRTKRHVWYVGELDGYATYDEKEWTVERKFTSQVPSDLVGRFQLDDQVRGYTWAMRRLGRRPVGALVDIIRTTKYPALVRDFVVLDEHELNRFQDELTQVVQEIVDAYDQNRWPLSPHSCFNWGTCPYRMLCLNPDRVTLAEGMGYRRKELSHEEELLERMV
jgi:hypothetical protein